MNLWSVKTLEQENNNKTSILKTTENSYLCPGFWGDEVRILAKDNRAEKFSTLWKF